MFFCFRVINTRNDMLQVAPYLNNKNKQSSKTKKKNSLRGKCFKNHEDTATCRNSRRISSTINQWHDQHLGHVGSCDHTTKKDVEFPRGDHKNKLKRKQSTTAKKKQRGWAPEGEHYTRSWRRLRRPRRKLGTLT